jgi:hypothetical protein
MDDPIIIERKELYAIVDRAIIETLKSLGLKPKDYDPSITQNAAVKLMKESGCRKGLPSLRRAMFEGRVRWEHVKKTPESRGMIYVKKKDVLKLINQ